MYSELSEKHITNAYELLEEIEDRACHTFSSALWASQTTNCDLVSNLNYKAHNCVFSWGRENPTPKFIVY